MNCAVCLDDNILEIDVHYMECLHFVCDKCFVQLIVNSCPLCRHEIVLNTNIKSDKPSTSHNILEDEDDHIYDIYIPHIRRDRHENKRKKHQKKKEQLDNIIYNPKTTTNIPNYKKRMHKKIKFYNNNILVI